MKPSASPSAIALPLPMKGNLPTLTLWPAFLRLGLGQADRGDLRPRIGAARDVPGLERVRLLRPGDRLDADHALVARLVRQPGRAGDVADRVDALDIGAAVAVGDDMAAVGLHAQRLEADILAVGDDADGDDGVAEIASACRPCP